MRVRRHYGSFGYKELPRFARAKKGVPKFFALSTGQRRLVLPKLIAQNRYLGLELALEGGDRVFNGFDAAQRRDFWFQILCHNDSDAISQKLKITRQKALDLLEVILLGDSSRFADSRFEDSRIYWLANLLCYLKWQHIPNELKQHPIFAGMVESNLRQGLVPEISPGGRALCPVVEANFVRCVENDEVMLVNDHLLFRTRPEWSVAVCLRTFVSPDGSVFIRGMYYFVDGASDRKKVGDFRRAGEARLVLKDIRWRPGRYYHQLNCPAFDLDRFSRKYPSKMT